ncbi:putative RING finger protein [Yarrowia sp. E02]|nr:putative RING finger protein [Yarrowia sp. E02]
MALFRVLTLLGLGLLVTAQYSPEELQGYYGLVEPTNRTQNNYNSFSLTAEGDYVTNIQALTVETDKLAGLNSAAAVSGNLRSISGNYTGPALDWSNAALVACDNTTDVIDALNLVLINNPACTILYSLESDACHFTRPYRVFSADVGFLFTTVSAQGAHLLLEKVQEHAPGLLNSVAWLNTTSLPEDDTPVVDDHGPSKDTKIAMAVLYCICGVLALAVVVLISLGIWRVHRHPERYGLAPPMTDEERQISDDFNNGGGDVYTPPPTRVEKAKGLARAVLDAIPLMRVMIGEKESDSEKGKAVEVGQTETGQTENGQTEISRSPTPSDKPDTSTVSVKSSCDMSRMETLPVYIQKDDNCAICFDNFEDNQIIRQLPCSHRFHAECVDHWLLNSSSQCPMCRMNLQKEDTEATGTNAEASTSTQPQPANRQPSVITVTQRDLNISLATRIIDWWNMLCLPEDARAEARERLNHESELRRKIRQLRRSDGTLMPNDGIVATDDGALRVLLDNRPLQAPPIDVPLSERMLVPGPDLDLNNVEAPVPRYSVLPHMNRGYDGTSNSQTNLLPHLDLSDFTMDVDGINPHYGPTDSESDAGDVTRVDTRDTRYVSAHGDDDKPDDYTGYDSPTKPSESTSDAVELETLRDVSTAYEDAHSTLEDVPSPQEDMSQSNDFDFDFEETPGPSSKPI